MAAAQRWASPDSAGATLRRASRCAVSSSRHDRRRTAYHGYHIPSPSCLLISGGVAHQEPAGIHDGNGTCLVSCECDRSVELRRLISFRLTTTTGRRAPRMFGVSDILPIVRVSCQIRTSVRRRHKSSANHLPLEAQACPPACHLRAFANRNRRQSRRRTPQETISKC